MNNRLVLHSNDKMWAQTSISQQTAFTFPPAGGQLASSFIISWYSPRLPLLQQVENVLLLINSPGTESHLDIGLRVLFCFQPSPSFKVIFVITHLWIILSCFRFVNIRYMWWKTFVAAARCYMATQMLRRSWLGDNPHLAIGRSWHQNILAGLM